LEDAFGRMMNFRDGDAHGRLRRLVTGAFSARRIAAVAATVEDVVGQLVDDALDRGGFDAVADLGVPLRWPPPADARPAREVWPEVTGWAKAMTPSSSGSARPPRSWPGWNRQLDALTGS